MEEADCFAAGGEGVEMWFWAGAIGLGLSLLHLSLSLAGGIRRRWLEGRIYQLRIEKLRDEIGALRRGQVAALPSGEVWTGYRKFRVLRKRMECENCQSIYLGPHDGRPLAGYRPGQYLTLSLPVPGERAPLVRCYSLSDSPREDEYRITVRKICEPAGRVSSYLCDTLKAGDIVDVRAPQGKFFLDLASQRPVVFLGAGIGVTPLIAMLNTLLDVAPDREVYLFLGMRSSREHPFKVHCESLAARHSRLRLVVCYSLPRETDKQGEDYQRLGRLDARIVSAILPSSNFEFFLCGPGEFMESMLRGLREWGVPDEAIHAESFGPSSCKRLREPSSTENADSTTSAAVTAKGMVRFDRSGREVPWTGNTACLLDLADGLGIAISSGCRTGSCGSCATAIKSGQVRYASPADYSCEEGVCLPCVCVPDGALVLDA